MWRQKLAICLLLILPTSIHAKTKVNDATSKRIRGLYSRYFQIQKLPKQEQAEQFIKLDGELRQLVDKPANTGKGAPPLRYWEKEYEAIGLVWTGGQNQDNLIYSGKLLADAKVADVDGRFREYTSYVGIQRAAKDDDLPDIRAAQRYATEFPNGPFISEALGVLGLFYSDQYRDIKMGVRFSDCLDEYKPKLSKKKRLDETKRLALEYLNKAIERIPTDEKYRIRNLEETRDNVKTGKRWTESHFCSHC